MITFEEVSAALKAGMIDCAITSAGSGNHAGWGTHSTHLFTLGTHLGINGYVINLDLWRRFSSSEQRRLHEAFQEHIAKIWAHVEDVHQNAIACSVGKGCADGVPNQLTLAEPTERDYELFHRAFRVTTFADWAKRCDKIHPGCSSDWRDRVSPLLNARNFDDFR